MLAPSRPALLARLRGAALLCLCAATLSVAAAGKPPVISDEEAAVFAAVINHGLDRGAKSLVIAETTTGDAAALAGDAERSTAITTELGLPPAVFADWARRNTRFDIIDRPLTIGVTYQMLGMKTLREIFAKDEPKAGWQAFFARYPEAAGLIRLSHAGFDETGQHALLYLEHQCGADCGTGRLVYLQKTMDGWTVNNATLVWMTE